jgi:hypothetical protein
VLKKVDKMDLPEDDLKGTQAEIQVRRGPVVVINDGAPRSCRNHQWWRSTVVLQSSMMVAHSRVLACIVHRHRTLKAEVLQSPAVNWEW